MKKNILLGSHVEFKKPDYILGANNISISYGSNAMMIFLGAPQNTKRIDEKEYKFEEFLQQKERILQENIVIHAPYIVNCSNPTKSEFAVNFLTSEINRMSYIGAKYLVLHPGSATTFTKEQAYQELTKSIKSILSKTKNVVICLETMSGKGTEVGDKIENLVEIIKQINDSDNRVAICLDTCHLWDSGYDIKNFKEFMNYLTKNDFLKYIKVIHINDSKNDISSHKDRHENIGKGFIGLETLRNFVHDEQLENCIKILETPWIDNKPPYAQEIEILLKK